MKTALLLSCLFFATAALGQAGSALSAEPTVIEFSSHAQHASQRDLGQSQNVMEESRNYIGRGERPLWELAPPLHEISLGEVARALKEEHAAVKKSKVVWTN